MPTSTRDATIPDQRSNGRPPGPATELTDRPQIALLAEILTTATPGTGAPPAFVAGWRAAATMARGLAESIPLPPTTT